MDVERWEIRDCQSLRPVETGSSQRSSQRRNQTETGCWTEVHMKKEQSENKAWWYWLWMQSLQQRLPCLGARPVHSRQVLFQCLPTDASCQHRDADFHGLSRPMDVMMIVNTTPRQTLKISDSTRRVNVLGGQHICMYSEDGHWDLVGVKEDPKHDLIDCW